MISSRSSETAEGDAGLPLCVMQNTISPFGAFLDPVADKLMVAAVLVSLL